MKYTLLACLMLVSWGIAKGQFTFSANNGVPTPGEYFTYDSVAYTNPGASGAGVTWDFSNLSSEGMFSLDWMAASSVPNHSSFPGATVGYTESGNNYFFSSTSTEFSRDGYVSAGIVIPYSDKQDLLRFPMTFNDAFVDTFGGVFYNIATYTRSGTISATVDGYGTLILPWGTLNNVMRIKYVEDFQDDYVFNQTTGTYNYDSESYVWYKEGISYSVMFMYNLISDVGNIQYGVYMRQLGVGEDEYKVNEHYLEVFPNPSNTGLVHFNKEVNGFIYNALGKEVMKVSKADMLNVESLTAGLYFLKTDNGLVRKFIVN